MFQKQSLIAVLLMVAATSVMAANSGLIVADKDREKGVKFYPNDQKDTLDDIESRLPDGVRGMTSFEHPEPVRMNDRPSYLRQYACSFAIFGVAELQDSKSFVAKDDKGILTKLRFKMVDSWSAGSGPKDPIFDLIVPGGEVEYKGEMFRIRNPLATYVSGHRYLMIIQGDDMEKTDTTFVGVPRLREVSNGIIHGPFSAPPFESGMRLDSAKASVQEALEQKGCE